MERGPSAESWLSLSFCSQLNLSRLLEHDSLCRKLFELQRLELNEAFLGNVNTAAADVLDVVFHMCPGSSCRFNDWHDFTLTEEAMSFVRARLEEAGLGFWDVDRLAAAHSRKNPASTPFLAT